MDQITLGRTGLRVGVACLGTGGSSRIGQRAGAPESHSIALVHAALEAGANLIDTAPAYGTEEVVGKALKDRRDRAVIATKARVNRLGGSLDSEDYLTLPEMRESIETSLKKLQTDYMDIFLLHGVRKHQYHKAREALPLLKDMQKEGKIRFIGFTEGYGVDLEHEVALQGVIDGEWDVMMLGCNMINHSIARKVLPATIKNNIGTMGMYAVRGALAKKETTVDLVKKLIASGEVTAADVDAEDPLGFVLRESDAKSQTEACYRFCRHLPGLHVTMTGTGSMDHLKHNLADINSKPLPQPVVDKIFRIFGRVITATGDLPAAK